VYEVSYIDGCRRCTAKVKGKASPRSAANTELETTILCNGTDFDRNQRDVFESGERLFLYFRAPVSGYLCVYQFVDEEKVYRLLPISSDTIGWQKVKSDSVYIFFSGEEVVEMCTERSVEQNKIWIVFSPNPFSKPIDNADNTGIPQYYMSKNDEYDTYMPPSLSFEKFKRWLEKLRMHDEQMVDKSYLITINGK